MECYLLGDFNQLLEYFVQDFLQFFSMTYCHQVKACCICLNLLDTLNANLFRFCITFFCPLPCRILFHWATLYIMIKHNSFDLEVLRQASSCSSFFAFKKNLFILSALFPIKCVTQCIKISLLTPCLDNTNHFWRGRFISGKPESLPK